MVSSTIIIKEYDTLGTLIIDRGVANVKRLSVEGGHVILRMRMNQIRPRQILAGIFIRIPRECLEI